MLQNLTTLEIAVLDMMVTNDYGDTPDHHLWTNCLLDCSHPKEGRDVEKVQLPGVISSLVKKGLVVCDGSGKEATVALTNEGQKAVYGVFSWDGGSRAKEIVVGSKESYLPNTVDSTKRRMFIGDIVYCAHNQDSVLYRVTDLNCDGTVDVISLTFRSQKDGWQNNWWQSDFEYLNQPTDVMTKLNY